MGWWGRELPPGTSSRWLEWDRSWRAPRASAACWVGAPRRFFMLTLLNWVWCFYRHGESFLRMLKSSSSVDLRWNSVVNCLQALQLDLVVFLGPFHLNYSILNCPTSEAVRVSVTEVNVFRNDPQRGGGTVVEGCRSGWACAQLHSTEHRSWKWNFSELLWMQ